MTRVIFKHIRASANLGDTWCSPYDHLPGLSERWTTSVHDLKEPTPPCDAVIYGGGKIMGGLAETFGPHDLAARHRIAWGVSTVQKFPWSPRYARAYRQLTLVGTRDWDDRRFAFAPCATCMASDFDAPTPPEHEVVAYLHHWRAPKMGLTIPDDIPVQDNRYGDFSQTIAFIASGETVVTNSYHGTYWALLLGRKVLCIPFSNKFHSFRVAPGYAKPSNWRQKLALARASDEMLALCRAATEDFATQVTDLVDRV